MLDKNKQQHGAQESAYMPTFVPEVHTMEFHPQNQDFEQRFQLIGRK